MQPKIIFKQRHRDTKKQGKPFSPADNASHLQYIGEREGVLRTGEPDNHLQYIGKRPGTLDTKDMNNGLFGYINGAFVPSTALSAAQSHIRKVSHQRLDIFRCVFSFTPETAAEAGLNSLADWQRFVTSSMNRVAQNMDMKIESVEWYASVHLKEGQPHVHIMYWDLNQKVRHNKLDPKICDKIRIDVIKDTYHSQFTQLRQREDELMKQMRTEVSSAAQNALLLREPNEYIHTAAKMLNSIYGKLPPKGQLVYAYMPQELKAEIDRLTHYIVDNNEQAAQLYSELLHTRQIYNEMLHSPDTNWGRYNLAKYKDKLCEDIDTRMGNIILKALSQEKKHNKTVLDSGLFHSDSYEPPVIPDEPQDEEPPPTAEKHYYIKWSKQFKDAKAAEREQNDIGKALRLYKAEASKGNVLAIYEIADIFRRGLVTSTEEKINALFRNTLERFMQVETTATTMKPYLQYRIGRMYYDGYGTEQNMKTALKWLEQAAEGGNHNAQYTVGKMFRDGIGTERNAEKALTNIRRAAESGHIYAKAALARLYLQSKEPSLHTQAETILNEIIKQAKGEQKAYFESILGAAYYYSDTLRDTDKAKELLEHAEQNGCEYATILLNRIDEHERNAVDNLLRSLMTLLNSAEQHTNAEFYQASKLLFGRGDLSKEMIAELIYKRQDKENTSQR